jgi:hypothetical protein
MGANGASKVDETLPARVAGVALRRISVRVIAVVAAQRIEVARPSSLPPARSLAHSNDCILHRSQMRGDLSSFAKSLHFKRA